MKPWHIFIFLALGLLLAACGTNSVIAPAQAEAQPTSASPTQAILAPPQVIEIQQTQVADPAEAQLAELTDDQGAVVVIVKPIALDEQAQELLFEVALETHSVDLSMDLAALATLTTDTDFTVQADRWDAPRGGHHVSGTLSFPASLDGKAILTGATQLTLTIRDVDVPERIFAWDLR